MAQVRIKMGNFKPVYVGEWDANTSYSPLDVVRFRNCLYICKKACTGQYPDKVTSTNYQYSMGEYWVNSVMYLRPQRDTSDNFIQFLTVVSRGGNLYYSCGFKSYIAYTDDSKYFKKVIDWTKGI